MPEPRTPPSNGPRTPPSQEPIASPASGSPGKHSAPAQVDILSHNRAAWDLQAARGDRWTVPVTPEDVARARRGELLLQLTPSKMVPSSWLQELHGREVLGLASGGGQQCPLFAAAGARVTSLDVSAAQLQRDGEVAARDGLDIRCIQGDMADLGALEDAEFDLVFQPVSNCFVPNVRPVWQEIARVLKPGGVILAGFINPLLCLFDAEPLGQGVLSVRHALPYSDLTSITAEERSRMNAAEDPLTFGHTLTDQIAGQTDAGLAITGFYEDNWGDAEFVLDRYSPSFIATRAQKL